MGEQYWPFPVKPDSQWSERDRDIICFMRQAYAEGFRPRAESISTIGAESPAGRRIELIFRGGGHGWEPFMSDGIEAVRVGPIFGLGEHGCVCIGPRFSQASYFALQWLRGNDLTSLVADYQLLGVAKRGRNVIALRSAFTLERLTIA